MGQKQTNKTKAVDIFGVVAQFESVPELYRACEGVKKKGYNKWDAHSPFPVHGIDKVIGIPQSKPPWLVMCVSAICGIGGYSLWVWMNGFDYKFVIAGKPFLGLTGYFIPGFECAVLSAAVTCLLGMFFLNKQPQWYSPWFRSKAFVNVTNDKFFIAIEASDSKFDRVSTAEFLKELGATQVEFVEP